MIGMSWIMLVLMIYVFRAWSRRGLILKKIFMFKRRMIYT
jgi:hypothetical protein